MDIEFHYYMMHLIAARAGLRGDDLRIVPYACQYTDDNCRAYTVAVPGGEPFRNRISQTMDVLKPRDDQMHIYPLFHFIPGDANAASTRRKDGATRTFTVTPDSRNANRIIDRAIASRDRYRIGIAAHAYADTWAHQNFVGYRDHFNAFPGLFRRVIPNIGHADIGDRPDRPALPWRDVRLVSENVDNTARFLSAACCVFARVRRFCDTTCSATAMDRDARALEADLRVAIGAPDRHNRHAKERIARYQDLASRAEYGSAKIPAYHKTAWFDAAVKSEYSDAHETMSYVCRPGFAESDWYRFQRAVKDYAAYAEEIVNRP